MRSLPFKGCYLYESRANSTDAISFTDLVHFFSTTRPLPATPLLL